MRQMVNNRCTVAVIEVTSEGSFNNGNLIGAGRRRATYSRAYRIAWFIERHRLQRTPLCRSYPRRRKHGQKDYRGEC